MRKIRIMNGMDVKEVIASIDTGIRELFEQNGMEVGAAQISVDGGFVSAAEANGTLRDIGYTDDGERTIFIQAVINTKNAR